MSKKQHWTAEATSYRMSRGHKPVWALVYDAMPGGKKNEDGTTSYSMRFPSLILSEYIADPEATAKRLADLLNAPSPDPRLAMAREALHWLRANYAGAPTREINGRIDATLTALEEGK